MVAKSVFQTLEDFDHVGADVGGGVGKGVDVFVEGECEGADAFA